MNVLVDTSVWSLALRRKPEGLTAPERLIVDELADLTREGRVRVIGLVRQELLSGIRSAAQYEKLRLALRAFPTCRSKPQTTRQRPGPVTTAGRWESWLPL